MNTSKKMVQANFGMRLLNRLRLRRVIGPRISSFNNLQPMTSIGDEYRLRDFATQCLEISIENFRKQHHYTARKHRGEYRVRGDLALSDLALQLRVPYCARLNYAA